ncbi:MAG: hypothetical protein PHY02_09090 [Phycisphaerae bacterium]|nr:hypothetical protein [Phycisphaerae bacterium]
MSNSKTIIVAVIFYLLACGFVLAYDVPNPNFNNDDIVDFADFGILAINWLQSGDSLAGDFDDSNAVDIEDLLVFSWYWLTEYSEYQQCQDADLDIDGIIAFEDMALFAQNWLVTGEGLAGDFDISDLVDYNDLSVMTDCWLEGTRPGEVWEQFKTALAVGDVNLSVSYFTEISAEKYRTFFEQVQPYLPQMVNEMGELIFIEQNEEMAYYDVLREEEGQLYAYPVIFVMDEMGQWKIYDF